MPRLVSPEYVYNCVHAGSLPTCWGNSGASVGPHSWYCSREHCLTSAWSPGVVLTPNNGAIFGWLQDFPWLFDTEISIVLISILCLFVCLVIFCCFSDVWSKWYWTSYDLLFPEELPQTGAMGKGQVAVPGWSSWSSIISLEDILFKFVVWLWSIYRWLFLIILSILMFFEEKICHSLLYLP